MNENIEDNKLHEFVNEYILTQKKKRKTPSVAEIEKVVEEYLDEQNNAPNEDFEGYSPNEMFEISYSVFEGNGPLIINTLSQEEYMQIPLFCQIKRFIQFLIDEQKIKLTPAGYLPMRIVKEIYSLGVPDYQLEYIGYKISKELDAKSVQLVRAISKALGIVKKRNGYLSLTAKGNRKIEDSELFNSMLKLYFHTDVIGFFDDYEDEVNIGLQGLGYSLVLLSKYGNIERPMSFYAEKYFKIFPMLRLPSESQYVDSNLNCYSLRTYKICLENMGLVKINPAIIYGYGYVQKTELFDKLIKVLPHIN